MAEIGYYNYYNNPHRYSCETVQERYSQMVERYNSPELHSCNQDPYSEENLAVRKLDEKLASMAESVRAKCATEDDVSKYLSQKYFGTERFGYTKRDTDPEAYAMYENDYNAICYGTVGGANRNDPRLNYTEKDWDTYEAQQKASAQMIISNQMNNLLESNGVSLLGNEQFLISFNPYSYAASTEGSADISVIAKMTELLNSGNNSKELMFYVMQNTSLDADSLAKYRAYQAIKDYTGEDLSGLALNNGQYYASGGKNILDLIKASIESDDSIGVEFKGASYESIKNNIDTVAQKGWNGIPDLELSIGYSKESGFYILNQVYEA